MPTDPALYQSRQIFCNVDFVGNAFAFLKVERPHFGGRDTAGGPVQQSGTQALLYRSDRFGGGGLRNAEVLRSSAEAASFDNAYKKF